MTDNRRVATYSSFTGFCVIFNFTMTNAYLTVPYVLWHTGIAAGIITLMSVTFFSAVTAFWTLETMARAQAIETKSLRTDVYEDVPANEINTGRCFELPELCRMFLGRTGSFLYLLSFFLYAFFTLWMTNPIIGTGLSTNIPINTGIFRQCSEDDFGHYLHPTGGCWNTYSLFVLIFAAIVVPISCLELKQQAVFQVTVAIARFVVLMTMSVYSVISAADTQYHTSTSNITVTSEGDIPYTDFNINGFLAAVPVFMYAQMLEGAIPSLSQPISNKRNLVLLYTIAFVVTSFLYGFVGVTVAIYKRNDVKEVCTANWEDLTGSEHSVALRALSYFIVLFPALDASSGYPLIVLVMADTVESVFINDPRHMPNRITRAVHRFVWAMIPIICSVFMTNVLDLNKYSGLGCFFFVLWIPPFLQYRSKKVSKKLLLSETTPYSSWYSGNAMIVTVFVYGVVITVATFVGFLLPGSLS